MDPGFRQPLQWDIPLLNGFESEFVPNVSSDPGTHHFGGIDCPQLVARLQIYRPRAMLMLAYRYRAFVPLLVRKRWPIIFRGDSHMIGRSNARWTPRRLALSAIFSRIDQFLYVGEANRHYFRFHGCTSRQMHFSPHAIDHRRFRKARHDTTNRNRIRESWGVPDDAFVVLFAGKLEEKKSPLDLIRAFRLAALSNVHLVFVGSGEMQEQVAAEAQDNPCIHLAGFQNQSSMPFVYAAADLFVLPSKGAWETWGLAVNEAIASGTPVVVSNHVGCQQDLIVDGKTGFVFPAGDVRQLANALRRALSANLEAIVAAADKQLSAYTYSRASDGVLDAMEILGEAG